MFDKTKLREQFENPPRTFRVSPMTHGWAEDYRAQMDQGVAYGYGGAVTNVPFANGFIPTPVFWPREFHGFYNPWGCKELDMTE